MNWYTDTKLMLMILLFLMFLGGVAFYPIYSGLLLILSLIVFGIISLRWKERHIKLAGLVLLVLLSITNIAINGMKFGIDFSGGTRIPILLEHSVDQDTMDELVQAIKKRTSVLGLTEAKVRAIGDNEINVEIPSTDERAIKSIEDTLAHQGVFQGVVDGKVAVSGEDIFSTSIEPQRADELIRSGSDWGVTFRVDRIGAERFASAAKGKTDYPVYMYLDRPNNATLFYTKEQFRKYIIADSSERESVNAMKDALKLDEGEDLSVFVLDSLEGMNLSGNGTRAFVSENTSAELRESLEEAGYVIVEQPEDEMAPTLTRISSGVLILEKLEAAGLLTSPLLSSGITSGVPVYSFAISGSVKETDAQKKQEEASTRVKSITSILKGGSLSVQISLGSRTSLPATLGEEFLRLSLIGIAASLVAISLLIGLRYRNLITTLPVVAISAAELTILLSILGSFTIDLAAMAGIIAAIGVGVDAQIVITDELIKKKDHLTREEKMNHAFSIIKTNVIVATLSMVPLLFSGLVEVIGFAISTILGSLLGYLLTRPAYAALVGRIIGAEEKTEGA